MQFWYNFRSILRLKNDGRCLDLIYLVASGRHRMRRRFCQRHSHDIGPVQRHGATIGFRVGADACLRRKYAGGLMSHSQSLSHIFSSIFASSIQCYFWEDFMRFLSPLSFSFAPVGVHVEYCFLFNRSRWEIIILISDEIHLNDLPRGRCLSWQMEATHRTGIRELSQKGHAK